MLRIVRDLLDQQIIDARAGRWSGSTISRSRFAASRRLRRARSCWTWTSVSAASSAGCSGRAAAGWIRRAAAADSAQFDPLGRVQHRRAGPAAPAAAEHLVRAARGDAPGRPRRHRRGPRARTSARRFSRPSTAKWRPMRCPRSIPTCRPASSSRSSRRRPPTSSRRWRPTKPPMCSTSWRRRRPRRSWKRWSRRRRRKSGNCSSSRRTPPAA